MPCHSFLSSLTINHCLHICRVSSIKTLGLLWYWINQNHSNSEKNDEIHSVNLPSVWWYHPNRNCCSLELCYLCICFFIQFPYVLFSWGFSHVSVLIALLTSVYMPCWSSAETWHFWWRYRKTGGNLEIIIGNKRYTKHDLQELWQSNLEKRRLRRAVTIFL